MININHVTLVGRLTRDVELRKTQSNISVCQFNVAVDRRYKSEDPNAVNADFVNCLAWTHSADFLSKYATKGDIISVEGRIQTRNYDNDKGQKVYVTEIVAEHVELISKQKQDNSFANEPVADKGYSEDDGGFNSTPSLDISSDDLPFY